MTAQMPFRPGPAPEFARPAFRRARAGRGDVRTAILFLLAEQPMHGYQLIQELTERTGGAWRPSSGSVYPALQKLKDAGLVRGLEAGGRRVFELADSGRIEVERRENEPRPWDIGDGNDPLAVTRDELLGVAVAAMHVAHIGTSDELARGKKILADTSRRLYGLLAGT